MDEQLVADQLAALAGIPGALRVITNEHVHDGSLTCEDVEELYGWSLFDPRHFVVHDVIGIEDRVGGKLRAYTSEGDWCEGLPAALLKRLQEFNRYVAEHPDEEEAVDEA